jgi:hypothetical protein
VEGSILLLIGLKVSFHPLGISFELYAFTTHTALRHN